MEIDPAIISGLSGVLGALIGGGAAILGGALQHKREMNASRQAEARIRQRDAAQGCMRALDELAPDVIADYEEPLDNPEVVAQRSARIRGNVERITKLSYDLPSPWQDRLREAVDFLETAESLGSGPYRGSLHYHSVSVLVRNVARESHQLLAAYLRNEASVPVESDWWIEYRAAARDFTVQMEDEHQEDMARSADERARWLAAHPEVTDEIESRRQRK